MSDLTKKDQHFLGLYQLAILCASDSTFAEENYGELKKIQEFLRNKGNDIQATDELRYISNILLIYNSRTLPMHAAHSIAQLCSSISKILE